jgi:CheY-like chemotaxis protein
MKPDGVVLIVDDEPKNRRTVEALLAPLGCAVTFAGDGAEALARAARLQPDLILLDVMMPGLDGFEVCRRLRADAALAEVPVILVTALDDRESRLRGLEAGADDFVTKPFDRAELRARVRTVLRLNRYRRLVAERQRFAWMVEHADDGYLVLGDQGDEVLYANSRARLHLGLPVAVEAPVEGPLRSWSRSGIAGSRNRSGRRAMGRATSSGRRARRPARCGWRWTSCGCRRRPGRAASCACATSRGRWT